MHDFDRRLTQLLEVCGELSLGRRQRLSRPLRQVDLRGSRPGADAWLDAALMAATRALAHELLDTLALHLEVAQAACVSLEQELLLTAIAARETVLGRRVVFQVEGRRLGCGVLAPVEVVLQPPGESGDRDAPLVVNAESNHQSDAALASDDILSPCPPWRAQAFITSKSDTAPPPNNPSNQMTFTWSPERVRENPFACAAKIGQALAQAIEPHVFETRSIERTSPALQVPPARGE